MAAHTLPAPAHGTEVLEVTRISSAPLTPPQMIVGAVCLVLASNLYDESDYYRDYHDFLKAVH